MSLSTEQIKNGYWFHDPEKSFPPPRTTYPEDYDGTERLNLVCTQLDMSAYKQRKLVEKWVEILPTLTELRALWLSSRIGQRLFEAVCDIPNLTSLFVKWSGVKDISSLIKLSSLKHLHIGSSSQIQSIECLEEMRYLVVLELENLKNICSLEPIGKLNQLEGLAVEGSIWSTQQIDSLSPLANLKNLKYLFLTNLRSRDGTLKPLVNLVTLVNLRIAFWWPEDEYALLRNALPRLKYGSLFDDDLIARFSKRGGSV